MNFDPIHDQTELLFHIRQCFGASSEIERCEQFKGGARKQVFFLTIDAPQAQCVLYIWHNAENYFAERVAAGFEETQTDDKAPALFLLNTRFLLENGVNVPSVLYSGTLATGYRFAFVEQIVGRNFDAFAADASNSDRQAVLAKIAVQLGKMHGLQRDFPGALQDEAISQKAPQDRTLDRAYLEVDATAEMQSVVAQYQAQIRAKLQELRDKIVPRSRYHLIHGELAGGHVLVRESDQAVYFVDIEGIHFTDLECEHTFLQLIYAADYQFLARADLDPMRMAFYKFAMHVSLVYAGSCFMLRGFHDPVWAENLFKGHLAQMLSAL